MLLDEDHSAPPSAPLRYHPAVEQPEADEAATADGLVAALLSISETTYRDGGRPLRSVHAKSHALLTGEIEILADLPPVLAQGLFAQPARYPVAMRVSTIPGDLLDDNVSVPRGMALKIIGVPGERLAGSEDDATQDFVMVNGPVFAAPTGKAFLKNLKLLAGTTDKAEGAKKALSTVLQSVESVVEAFGGKSATLVQLGGHPETNPLGETYFTQAPLLYGDYIAKFALVPVSPELTALTNAKVDLSGKPDRLRQAAIDFFHAHGGVWELRAQLCCDLETMPVEDSTVEWPQETSAYVPVARVTVASQEAWSAAKSKAFDDGLSFSPWHGLAAHRPLGSIMRLRKPAYRMSARFRFERNGCPMMEPKASKDISG
ncbi:catalase family protein [Bosea sp. (in: a-proteobacteria)]|uniref:catalase family protein n=1 Tax=Bosea sp. (in: a-proteobacteria) TaxID=1871050 RepID=UPI0035696A0E